MNAYTHPRTGAQFGITLAALVACLSLAAAVAGAAEPLRPHIVHIVADDLGWGDVGYHGVASDLKTPNPEKLRGLQKRANELAATMAPPLFIKTGVTEVMELPPAFPWVRREPTTSPPMNRGRTASGAAAPATPAAR